MSAKSLDVKIMGRDFRVACEDGEEKELLAAVDYLDRRMSEIRDSGKVIGAERIAIMAALNITHEFLTTKVPGGFDVAEFKRRMAGIETTLDQALADQEKLF